MYTREEFRKHLIQSAVEMAKDAELKQQAHSLLIKADQYNWIHQTEWLGEPILQLPQDMLAIQKIIFETRPRFIVELGIAWAGSLLFYATLMEILGGEQIIGVDIYIPEDLKQRINSFVKLSQRISWINGSSIDESTIRQLRKIIGDSRDVMVILDTYHTESHVLEELRQYSPLVGKGHYVICCDTHIELIPQIVENRPRPWGKGNNPKTALDVFLKENDRFQVDTEIENKLLLTLHPGGYLLCRKD